MKNPHFWLAVGIGAAAGFFLANAASGTGIYSLPVGQTLANLWSSGFNAGGGTDNNTGTVGGTK